MANRTPTSGNSDQPTEEMIARSLVIAQQIADRTVADAKAEARRIKAEAETEARTKIDPAAEAPNSAASEVDPIPATPAGPGAATPDAARASEPALTSGSGGEAGSGRPLVSEHGICTDCGRSLTWDEIIGHWWHDDPEVAAMAAFGLDGHLVHRDKLPAHHPNMLGYRPARRSRDHDPITGRFLPKSDTSARVAAEHALIDMDARLYQDDVDRRISGALTAVKALAFNVEALRLEDALAVKAGMLVRLGSEDGGS